MMERTLPALFSGSVVSRDQVSAMMIEGVPKRTAEMRENKMLYCPSSARSSTALGLVLTLAGGRFQARLFCRIAMDYEKKAICLKI
jgi:hypothetical protein